MKEANEEYNLYDKRKKMKNKSKHKYKEGKEIITKYIYKICTQRGFPAASNQVPQLICNEKQKRNTVLAARSCWCWEVLVLVSQKFEVDAVGSLFAGVFVDAVVGFIEDGTNKAEFTRRQEICLCEFLKEQRRNHC